MTRVADAVAIDFTADGVPRSIGLQGDLYLVSDTPTRLEIATAAHDALTHPPAHMTGWRFQASSAQGDAMVFDVAQDRDGCWVLLDVYR